MNPSVLLAHMLDAAASLLDDAVLCILPALQNQH